MRAHRILVAAACAVIVAGCSSGDDGAGDAATTSAATADAPTSTSPPPPPAYQGYVSEVYAEPDAWLCRPDKDDVCDTEMDATVVEADGTTEVEEWTAATDPAIDCFYVYPTISADPGTTSDMIPGENEELFVVRQQAARLGSQCRVFAPVYRQLTLTALLGRLGGTVTDEEGSVAPTSPYDDVVDSWKHYMANDNDGRGVVLIGHSQGAGMLKRLAMEEIDPDAAMRGRLVSALLVGTAVRLPDSDGTGGDFANIPLCGAPDQIGCVVSYATFRDTAPPPEATFFGVVRGDPEGRVACVNPAAPGGGSAPLRPYLPTNGGSLPIGGGGGGAAVEWVDPALGTEIGTEFVTLPGLVEGQCAERDGVSYLEIHVNGDPSDPRIDDIGGDLTPEWGMHLVDVSVAMGDLVDLVGTQAGAYADR